jgi:hypothetical protein
MHERNTTLYYLQAQTFSTLSVHTYTYAIQLLRMLTTSNAHIFVQNCTVQQKCSERPEQYSCRNHNIFKNVLWNIVSILKANDIVLAVLHNLLTWAAVPTHHRSCVCAIRMQQ